MVMARGCIPPFAGAAASSAPVADTLLARVGGSQELLREIIELFLEDSPKLLEDIRSALQDGDTQAAYRAAHTLKGSAGNFDAHDVVTLAQRLEARTHEGNLAAARTVFVSLELETRALLASLHDTKEALLCAS